ncbi:hypothetical protein A6A25_15925 [Saccharothrix sp. CB00851]|nr:hypothetical protein A6A25_15925 [Saccharothrix sp. CB00851]
MLVHHAGGSRLLYRGWERLLPADWEVVALDAPGRGRAHNTPASDNVEALADRLLDRVLTGPETRLALFGHSTGAALVTRMASKMVAAGTRPVWLGLSGWTGRVADVPAAVRDLTDEKLLPLLHRWGGTPSTLLTDAGLRGQVLPLVRADLEALAGFDPMADRSWLTLPLSLFSGLHDPGAGVAELAVLAARAPRLLNVHLHPGDHFYLTEHPADVAAQITADLGTALRWREVQSRPRRATRSD